MAPYAAVKGVREEVVPRPAPEGHPNASDAATFTPARIREQAASDKLVAFAISLSENASSFGAISR
jgi:hypothetical protein